MKTHLENGLPGIEVEQFHCLNVSQEADCLHIKPTCNNIIYHTAATGETNMLSRNYIKMYTCTISADWGMLISACWLSTKQWIYYTTTHYNAGGHNVMMQCDWPMCVFDKKEGLNEGLNKLSQARCELDAPVCGLTWWQNAAAAVLVSWESHGPAPAYLNAASGSAAWKNNWPHHLCECL